MDKISRLKKEIEELKRQQQEAQDLIKKTEKSCREKYKNIIDFYREFYDKKLNTEFVLYDRFPSVEALHLYVNNNEKFPLYNNGNLNAKELAEIIKHIYQFKTGKEYNILTIGVTEQHAAPIYGGQVYDTIPHLFFMIGNEKTLTPYQQFGGKFINEDKLYSHIYLHAKGRDLITIELDEICTYLNNAKLLDIECFTGNVTDEEKMINYYDLESNQYSSFNVSAVKQIFSTNIKSRLSHSLNKIKGIKDVLDFDINYMDSYIAKVLISIIIYKRNNNIEELTENDYNHIFDVLFGEKVDITASVVEDFPKSLIYVPNKQNKK